MPAAPVQDNLAVPSQSQIEARKATAMELQAQAAVQVAAAAASAMGTSGNPARDEFREVFLVCLQMRVATDLNGTFAYAQEVIDGLDLRYPAAPATGLVPPKTSP